MGGGGVEEDGECGWGLCLSGDFCSSLSIALAEPNRINISSFSVPLYHPPTTHPTPPDCLLALLPRRRPFRLLSLSPLHHLIPEALRVPILFTIGITIPLMALSLPSLQFITIAYVSFSLYPFFFFFFFKIALS